MSNSGSAELYKIVEVGLGGKLQIKVILKCYFFKTSRYKPIVRHFVHTRKTHPKKPNSFGLGGRDEIEYWNAKSPTNVGLLSNCKLSVRTDKLTLTNSLNDKRYLR